MELSWCDSSSVNQSATAHRLPLVTAVTPCMFSLPAEKPTILPHFALTYDYKQTKNTTGGTCIVIALVDPAANKAYLKDWQN